MEQSNRLEGEWILSKPSLENYSAGPLFLIPPVDTISSFLCLLACEKHTGPLTTGLVGIMLTNLSFSFLYTNLKVDLLPFEIQAFFSKMLS